MTQLRRDFLIHSERDGQTIFDALGAQKKDYRGSRNRISVFRLTTISVGIPKGCSAGSPSTCDLLYLKNALSIY